LNLLDENFPADQATLLRRWRIPHRQFGRDFSLLGVQDADIIPLLHRIRRATLFTQDQDFFKRRLCHAGYCLVWLDMKPGQTADYVRRFLRHPMFDTHANRLGKVLRVHPHGITYWHPHARSLQKAAWRHA